METVAYIESAIAHEDSDRSVRSFEELGFKIPSSAWVGLVGILLSASMIVAQVPQAQAIPVTVQATSGLSIRSGPSVNYGIIGGLSNGTTVDVASLATTNGFYRLSSGGWIASAYTSTGGGTGGGGTPGGTGIDRRVTITGNVVNVRNGPGTNFGLNGRPLYYGETVRVVRLSSNGWYQLTDGGWFSSSYATAGGTGGGGSPGGTSIDRRVTVTGNVVNVRNGSGTGYGLNGRPLYYGETVRVVRLSSNGWYQLSDGGWFSSSYATTGGTGGGGSPGGTGIDRYVTVTGDVVNVRNGPGTGYGLNGRPVYRGERLRVVRLSSNGWYQLSDGGWFSSSYATTSSGGTGGGGSIGGFARVSTNGSPLLVRSSPSGGVIGSLANGTSVRLSGRYSGGYAQLSSGGWVSTSWLS